MAHGQGQPPYEPPPGAPQAQFPDYYAPAGGPPPQRNGLGTAALVVGIIGVIFAIVPLTFWLGGPMGLVAIGLGIGALRRISRKGASNKGVAISGIILGALSTVIAAVWLAAAIFVVNDVVACLDSAQTPEQAAACGQVTP
ncbi:hypothetical protein DP939_03780 [Spongiactinospora rosea]|uniref:DUF4190 domain-containing protein n=1 Tax=Spongiactinospora rosea TaxID=2248750 RepID=A0A366M7K4_9ACTN|nr:DUF4190 domain-containing protein [Spongiactinospora rosea]RBQ21813.1 hypothetical protein DP939_03780 [Spongiactinospora rosea]